MWSGDSIFVDWCLLVGYQEKTMSEVLNRIEQLKAEIAGLEKAAVSDLIAKRASKVKELEALDAEIARISGKGVNAGRVKAKPGRPVSYQELMMLLERAAGNTINVRKEKLDLALVRSIAAGNPKLVFGGKGPWPTLSLVR